MLAAVMNLSITCRSVAHRTHQLGQFCCFACFLLNSMKPDEECSILLYYYTYIYYIYYYYYVCTAEKATTATSCTFFSAAIERVSACLRYFVCMNT